MASKRRRLFTLKGRRDLPRLAFRGIALVLRSLVRSCRVRYTDPGDWLGSGRPWPVIFAVWHNRAPMAVALYPRRLASKTAALASISRDGQYASAVLSEFGFQTVRGSSSRGGHAALRRLKQTLESGTSVVLTVDGPRGPRYEVQPGAVTLAALTGVPVVPAGIRAPARWDLRGWDRTQIPRPFADIEVVVGAPMTVPRDLDRAGVLQACALLRDQLLILNRDTRDLPLPCSVRWHGVGVGSDELAEAYGQSWWGDAQEVKQNRKRRVFRARDRAAGVERAVYLKVDLARSPWAWLKQRFRCKAALEAAAASALERAAVPAVRVLGWGAARGARILVSEEAGEGLDAQQAWDRAKGDPVERALYLQGLGRFLGRLQAASVVHPDLHTGNVLVCRRAGALEFVLVDLVGVRVGVRGGTPERALLGWLVGIERELTGVEKLELIRGSVVFEGSDSEVLRRWQRAMDRKRAEFRRRWPGRRARLLKTSSLCVRTRVDGGVLYLRRPFDRDTALAVLRAWKESEIPERDVLKQGAKRSLCRVRVDGRAYVLKAYLQPRRWDRLRPERRTWLNAYHLEALQLPVVPCLAWFAAADGTGVLVFEDGGERDLYWEMRYNRSADERRRLLRAAARLFAWTHAAGVRHGDFKATNVLVTSEPGRMPLGLVDTDQVRFDQRIGLRARLHNLNQFLGRATHDVTPFEIGRFLVWYARDACLERRELRWLRERIHLEDFQPPPDRHGGSPS